jgi:predicted Zn-dependent peptidase
MKDNLYKKLFFGLLALLLLLNFMQGAFSTSTATAEGRSEEIGRYQISAWSTIAGQYGHHSGYYIIDTTTGKVVGSKSEVHGVEK